MLNMKLLRYDLYNNIYFCKIRKWFVINTSNQMELNATLDIIIKDLNDARDIIDDLKKYPGVPELQVELAKSKCKSAAEIIALLKSVHVPDKPENEIKREMKEFVVNQDAIHKEKEVVAKVEDNHSPAGEQITQPVTEKVVKVMPQPIPVQNVQSAPAAKKPEQHIIADQFIQPASFNEEIGSHKQEDVLEIIRSKPLSSLTEAIGINDKFHFVREIFNGNQESYNEAIRKLESAGSFADATAIIFGYTGEDADNEAVKQLMDLIKRKFPSNE